MTSADNTWSPADNPYAIAVSEAQWGFRSALLTGLRIHGEDDCRVGFSSRQIDARHLVVDLWQLCVAEKLQQMALRDLKMGQAVLAELSRARARFDKAVPGLQQMRNGLLHFDQWILGAGQGPQRKEVKAGADPRIVASKYSRFGYDPNKDEIEFGPYSFQVATALEAARDLSRAIDHAARAVDLRTTAELRDRTVEAMAASGIGTQGAVRVSSGADNRIWVSLDGATTGTDREELAEQVVAVLAGAGLQLSSSREPQSGNPEVRLRDGEALYVELGSSAAQ